MPVSRGDGLSPGEPGEWVTSVDEGLAGGTSDYGLPSLAHRVSNRTAPSQPESGDDGRILDRMGASQEREP